MLGVQFVKKKFPKIKKILSGNIEAEASEERLLAELQ